MNTMREISIIGAGGFAAEVLEAAELSGWVVRDLYDDDTEAHGREVMGKKCVGDIDKFIAQPPSHYIFAIGNNKVRHALAQRLDAAGHQAGRVIHPSADVSRTAVIHEGAYVGATSFVGPQVSVGQHAIVNVASSIGHDAVIGDFAQICPGVRISGFGQLGVGAFVGSNAVVAPGVTLGEWSKLGASSFACRDVPASKLAIGVPARIAP